MAELLLPQLMVDPAQLTPHPMNAKRHNRELLRASVKQGLYSPIVVNKGTLTGRPMEILAGHGTREAWAAEHPGEPIQITLVDVDERRCKEILLVDNPGPEDPGYDPQALVSLLASLEGQLDLTGYTEDYLLTLQRIEEATIHPGDPIIDPNDEWWDMPDVPEKIDGVTPFRRVIVAFASQPDFEEFTRRLGQPIEGTAKKLSIWFPRREIRQTKEFRVVGADVVADTAEAARSE